MPKGQDPNHAKWYRLNAVNLKGRKEPKVRAERKRAATKGHKSAEKCLTPCSMRRTEFVTEEGCSVSIVEQTTAKGIAVESISFHVEQKPFQS